MNRNRSQNMNKMSTWPLLIAGGLCLLVVIVVAVRAIGPMLPTSQPQTGVSIAGQAAEPDPPTPPAAIKAGLSYTSISTLPNAQGEFVLTENMTQYNSATDQFVYQVKLANAESVGGMTSGQIEAVNQFQAQASGQYMSAATQVARLQLIFPSLDMLTIYNALPGWALDLFASPPGLIFLGG